MGDLFLEVFSIDFVFSIAVFTKAVIGLFCQMGELRQMLIYFTKKLLIVLMS